MRGEKKGPLPLETGRFSRKEKPKVSFPDSFHRRGRKEGGGERTGAKAAVWKIEEKGENR